MMKHCLLFSAIIACLLAPAALADGPISLGELLWRCQDPNWCQIYTFNEASQLQRQEKACFADTSPIDVYREVLTLLRQEATDHPERGSNDGASELDAAILKLHPCPGR